MQDPVDFPISPFPPEVVYVWGGANDWPGFQLAPAEQAVLGTDAAEKRREEFTRGRACAHEALEQLSAQGGLLALGRTGGETSPLAIPRQGRAPQWPQGVVGSITHSHGAAAAAVARAEDFLGIGLDLEPESDALVRVASRICRPEELTALEGLPPDIQRGWLAVIFSIKEGVFKALNPATGVYLGFQDARIHHDAAPPGPEGKVRWELLKECGLGLTAGTQGDGAYLRQEGWCLSAVWCVARADSR